jgi:hypothetical protein
VNGQVCKPLVAARRNSSAPRLANSRFNPG